MEGGEVGWDLLNCVFPQPTHIYQTTALSLEMWSRTAVNTRPFGITFSSEKAKIIFPFNFLEAGVRGAMTDSLRSCKVSQSDG